MLSFGIVVGIFVQGKLISETLCVPGFPRLYPLL